MRHPWFPPVAATLAIGIATIPMIAAAQTDALNDADTAGAEAFEVVVVRGAGVYLVTGTENGRIREVTLREDPTPPRPAPEPPRERGRQDGGAITITIFDGGGYGYAAPYVYPYFGGRHAHHHRTHERVFAPGKHPQRFHHASTRGRHPHRVGRGSAHHGHSGGGRHGRF